MNVEVISTGLFGMDGFELIDHGHIKPNGKIMFGGDIYIDNENGTFTIIDQTYEKEFTIEAKSPRSFITKLNKVTGRKNQSWKIINRIKYENELKKRDEAIQKQEN